MGSLMACISDSAYNTWTFLPATRQSCACRAASRNLHPTILFPSLQHGMAVARDASTVLIEALWKQVFSHLALLSPHRNQDTLWQCRLLLPPVAPAAATGVSNATGISNDGKIQGQTLEGSLPRYFLQILSQNEVRGAVSSHCWHTWAMSYAVGRCKGMEIHENMLLSERTVAVKFNSVICEADNTHHKSQNKIEMCGNCKSF